MRVSQRVVVAWIVLAGVLLVGMGLRAIGAAAKQTLEHDESWSYLQAAGNMDRAWQIAFEKDPPYGTWTAAGEWKQLLRPTDPLSLGRTAHDLSHFDIHPPLYFWLLHVAGLVVGTHLWTGPALNAVLDLIAAVALYRFARDVTGKPIAAALSAGLWLLSPAVLLCAMTEARQYPLLGLVTILFVHQVYLTVRDPATPVRWTRLLWLALTTALGLLSHYHFAIVIAGASLYALVALVRRDRRRLLRAAVAIAMGCALFVLIHPGFLKSIERQRGFQQRDWAGYPKQVARFLDDVTIPRLQTSRDAIVGFVARTSPSRTIVVVVVPVVLLAAVLVARQRRRATAKSAMPTAPTQPAPAPPLAGASLILFMTIWTIGVVVALFVLGQSPWHAMGYRYLAPAWPMLAILPALLWRISPRLGGALILLLIAVATLESVRIVRQANQWAVPGNDVLARAPRVILDNPDFGRWPGVLWHVPDDAPVLVAWAEDLAREPERFLDQIEPGTLYVSVLDARVRIEMREQILGRIAQRHRIDPVSPGANDALIYRVR